MKKIFNRIVSKNLLTLVSGTMLSSLLPLVFAPILSRIYSPDQFGRLAVYLSIVSILGTISNARYELAIVLPKKKIEGIALTVLSFAITFVFSFILFIVFFVWGRSISIFLGDEQLYDWILLVPASVFLLGCFNALNYYNTRLKKYKVIAKSNVWKSFSGNFNQFIFGFFKLLNEGLILGHFSSLIFGNLGLLSALKKDKKIVFSITPKYLKKMMFRYIEFPKFSLLGIFLNSLSVNLINFFISNFYSLNYVGFVSHAFKYLGLPTVLIGKSVGQIFLQELNEVKNDTLATKKMFLMTLKKMILFSCILFIPLYFFVENLFVFIFGDNWFLAGFYAKILIPLFFVRFIFNPLSLVNIVFEKQKLSLLMHFILFLFSLISMAIMYLFKMDIVDFLKIYSWVMIIVYLFLLYTLYRVSIKKI